ncbi:MAG: hypothetical protein WC753_04580 [Candidatus Gracilibacteria bacterium]|jgi:hypothetical protein
MDQAEGLPLQDIAPVGSSAQESAQEKMLRQSDVNELIGKAKHAAYEKGKREALDAHTQQPQSGSMGGMPQLTEEQVRQMIADEAQRQTQVTAAHNMLNNFAQQMGAGKGKYSDFDETVGGLGDLQNISHVVQMATETGMAGDVMYELGKNPGKVASLTTLAYINPQLAKVEMKKLADSIKMNDSAQDSPSASEPLSQVKPSTVGKDNGEYNVKDFRNKSWARG